MGHKFKVGDRVRHEQLGRGLVVQCEDGSDGYDYFVYFLDEGLGTMWIAERALTPIIPPTTEPSRAMIAAMCLQGFIANGEWDGNVIEVSVQYADALTAELAKPKQ
jgi:hypothetical protein